MKPAIRTRQSERIRKMVLASMLSAITAVLTFTPIGMIPLPPPLPSATMVHIPVLLAGMLYGPLCGASVGVLSPTLSFLIFGMPPAAKYPFMLIELIFYGLAAGLFERAFRRFDTLNLLLTTLFAQAAGRLAYAGCLWLGGKLLVGVAFPAAASVTAAVAAGLPGIVIQLVLVPAAYSALKKLR